MNMRSTRSTVTFSNPSTLPGCPGELPAGDYEVLVEEELLQGLSEMRVISESDLKAALGRGVAVIQSNLESQAALSPQEDGK